MPDNFNDIGSSADKFLERYGDKIIGTLVGVFGLIGTLFIAYAVQTNPQHLAFSQKESDIPGVYNLLYGTSSEHIGMAYTVLNDQIFTSGMFFLVMAFLLQVWGIWKDDFKFFG